MLRPTYRIGLGNFKQMINDRVFWLALRHSVVLTVIVVLLQLVLGLILAWAMKQEVPGMAAFRSVIMASWVIPVAATVTIFKFMAQPDVGFINIILRSIGLDRLVRYWFGDPSTAFACIILLHLWRNVPFYGITFLAAMQTIPESLYESAEIDGASPLQSFWHITLPGISHMIMVMVTIHVLWTFNNFDFVYLATGGGRLIRHKCSRSTSTSKAGTVRSWIWCKHWHSHALALGCVFCDLFADSEEREYER